MPNALQGTGQHRPPPNSYTYQCTDHAKVQRPCSTRVSSYFTEEEMETQVLAHARRSPDGTPGKHDAESHALFTPACGERLRGVCRGGCLGRR